VCQIGGSREKRGTPNHFGSKKIEQEKGRSTVTGDQTWDRVKHLSRTEIG